MFSFSTLAAPRRIWLGLMTVVLLGHGVLAAAQDDQAQADAGDPPNRVARLSYASGDLGMLPAGSSSWNEAILNVPLTNGDKLSSGADSRAELELGGGSLRMAAQTDVGLLNLNNQIAQVALNQGTLNLSVRDVSNGDTYEIDTPTIAVVVSQPGIFRIDVNADGSGTQVTVFNGAAIVYGENSAQQTVYAGRRYGFADSSLGQVAVGDIQGGDAFDAWSSELDDRYAQSGSNRYVADDVVGAQDLNNYGAWQDDPNYGQIWYPNNLANGWAPYRFGRWAWIAPWGWTWIDNLPWGFAPYHYGRWAYVGGAWGWLPGPRSGRAVYAPALVAFTGGGISSGGPVGWFPLGPGEIYNPWYPVSRGYYANVNIANIHGGDGHAAVISRIDNQYNYYQSGRAAPNLVYANRNAPNAFSAVSAQNFAGAHGVRGNLITLSPAQIAAAPVLGHGLPQRPTTTGFGPARAAGATVATAGFNRPVVARSAPPPTLPANTIVRGGFPTGSPVRVLGSSSTPIGTSARPMDTSREPAINAMARPGNGMPPIPHFERAGQLQPVQQDAPAHADVEPAQRSHEYVPEPRYMPPQPIPPQEPARYEPMRATEPIQDYARPTPQAAPKSRTQSPAARPREDTGH